MGVADYTIYQVNLDRVGRGFAFRSVREMRDMGDVIALANYDSVYSDVVVDGRDVLDRLFHVFNTDHPEGFAGRSMSVSDIVCLDGSYFYCDSFGWVDVTDELTDLGY